MDSLFHRIATKLFSKYTLRINNHAYQIAEVEFYLNCDIHPDSFTHSHKDQATCNQWYFHKIGDSYKGGTYKGLDMTFGNEGYGGILIRSLLCLETDTYIEGPCKVVNLILELTGKNSIADLVADAAYNKNVFLTSLLFLQKTDKREVEVQTSARVGLKLNNAKQIDYVMRPYRFLCYPKRVRKGRQHLVLELYHQGNDACLITECSEKQCQKWTRKFDEGYFSDKQPEDYFKKALKVDEFSEFYGVLKRITE